MAEKAINVLLFGCGGVGRQLLQHVVSTRSLHSAQGLRVAVVGVFDSQHFLSAKQQKELDDSAINQLCCAKEKKSSLLELASLTAQSLREDTISSTVRFITKSLGSLVLVDCTASDKIGEVLADVCDERCCLVFANKKPLTGSLDLYDKISALHRRFRCESTVGAGLPVIATLNRILNSGDTLKRIVGALSGTLGYVMSELQDGKCFSEIVRSAKALGYTEPDPRDDLSGTDVARKALIMARLLGWRLNMEDVEVQSLYPAEFAPGTMSMSNFLEEGLQQLDAAFKDRVEAAASKGCVLRYVATLDNQRCNVGLVEQPRHSALGQLRGSDNLLEIYTRCYSSSPLVIQGAGAGNDTTAAGVLADILDLQDLALNCAGFP